MKVLDIVKKEDLKGLEFKALFHGWRIYSGSNNMRYALRPLEDGYLVCLVYNLEQAKDLPSMYPLLEAEGIHLSFKNKA